jgi:hypothetical protein
MQATRETRFSCPETDVEVATVMTKCTRVRVSSMFSTGPTGPVFALSEEKCTRVPIPRLVGASSLLPSILGLPAQHHNYYSLRSTEVAGLAHYTRTRQSENPKFLRGHCSRRKITWAFEWCIILMFYFTFLV